MKVFCPVPTEATREGAELALEQYNAHYAGTRCPVIRHALPSADIVVIREDRKRGGAGAALFLPALLLPLALFRRFGARRGPAR